MRAGRERTAAAGGEMGGEDILKWLEGLGGVAWTRRDGWGWEGKGRLRIIWQLRGQMIDLDSVSFLHEIMRTF